MPPHSSSPQGKIFIKQSLITLSPLQFKPALGRTVPWQQRDRLLNTRIPIYFLPSQIGVIFLEPGRSSYVDTTALGADVVWVDTESAISCAFMRQLQGSSRHV